MDIEQIKRIKELAVIAMFSDDELLNILVLKGGSAIDMFLQSPGRASLDLDFSIDGDFHEDVESLRNKFERLLSESFGPENFIVFDVRFKAIPSADVIELPFWGGYTLEFKIAPPQIYEKYKDKLHKLRGKHATDIGPGQLKTFCYRFQQARILCRKGKTRTR
ncbi:MAG: nucleotidyl transferase AbiEii/AbiGii toxin family protein [Planctomycetes bacterium]|nr:nucleotidyl transferase AbiEii/AbiGii toxin family protein [Planctomycetota bacterium]